MFNLFDVACGVLTVVSTIFDVAHGLLVFSCVKKKDVAYRVFHTPINSSIPVEVYNSLSTITQTSNIIVVQIERSAFSPIILVAGCM